MFPPLPEKINTVYLDLETASFDPKIAALSPWRAENRILGAAITWDDEPRAWYFPLCHKFGDNLPQEPVFAFLREAMSRSETWCNHNINFDAHFLTNHIGPLPEHLKFRDTLTGSKLLDTDLQFKGGAGLDNLSKLWLDEDISGVEAPFVPYLHKNKNYAAIPADIMAPYACQDVQTARKLDKHIAASMPKSVLRVWATEQRLTKVLFTIEQRGLRVDLQELQIEELKVRYRMSVLEQNLHELIGRAINPISSNSVFDVLCTQYGLPVLGWSEDGKPSFDKFAMKRYLDLPNAPINIIECIAEYRKLATLLNNFLEPYQSLQKDGILHSRYNAVVRTGRMSSSTPNAQQLSKDAKALIHPRFGYAFLSFDLAGIEFRILCDYIENAEAISRYNADPNTDFHIMSADMCGISRQAAKTLNFMVAFGGGKAKTLALLSATKDLTDAGEAERVYNAWHAMFPELKPTARRATAAAKSHGYVKNLYGRRRHLPTEFAHIALNASVQGTAADIFKCATVRLADYFASRPEIDAHLAALVHDEFLIEAPLGLLSDTETLRDIVGIIEAPPLDVAFSVPIRTSANWSQKSWADCENNKVDLLTALAEPV